MSFLRKSFWDLESAFPTPRYFSLNPVAVDISPFAVRVMQLKYSKEGMVPAFFDEVNFEIPYDLTDQDTTEEEINAVVTALKKLKEKYKLNFVVASLPEQKTYIYRTILPRVAMSDLASAIRFSLEENVPLSANDVNFDYSVISNSSHSGVDEIEVVVNVFPKKIIKTYTDIFNEAGLTPISFQPESISLAKSVVADGDDRPFLIIRLMEDRANMAIVENGVVYYTTSAMINEKDILENPKGESYENLIESLNRVLVFWFTNKKELEHQHRIEDAIVVGKSANSEKLLEALEKDLQIEVTSGNVWTNNFSADSFIPKMTKEESLRYAAVVGLALKALRYR